MVFVADRKVLGVEKTLAMVFIAAFVADRKVLGVETTLAMVFIAGVKC